MKVAILGSGNGGRALAAAATRAGAHVTLYSRRPERIDDLLNDDLLCEFPGDGVRAYRLASATSDLAAAVADADLVLLSVPASQHAHYAELLRPWRRGLRLVLVPGSFAGTITFANAWNLERDFDGCALSETSTLPYAVRRDDRGVTRVSHQRSVVPYASLTDDDADQYRSMLQRIIPPLSDRESVLHTALSALNVVMHPPGMLLNAGRIEREDTFNFYSEGTTRGVAELIDALDRDRQSVARAFGVPVDPFPIAFAAGGYCDVGLDTLEAMRTSPGNRKTAAPTSLGHRYITEDVFFGLERMAVLADIAGLGVANTRAVIRLARTLVDQPEGVRTEDPWLPSHVADIDGLSAFINSRSRRSEHG